SERDHGVQVRGRLPGRSGRRYRGLGAGEVSSGVPASPALG
ncbi:MAG: hypothetical protein ACI88A_004938, partial [Paraglaciecola sp.]